jgi:hypothetical protein
MVDTTAESGGAGGASPAPEAAPVVADSVVPTPASDPAEVVGKRSAWEPEPSQLSDSVSDGARVRRRAPYWHRDDAPADTRVDGFAGWDDLPRGFMSAVFELLHEQTNAHRLVRAPTVTPESARKAPRGKDGSRAKSFLCFFGKRGDGADAPGASRD